MQDHTREKLEVYRHYLINYLSVMRNSRYFDKIIICEPFAGAGVNDDGSDGSAAIAARIISDERREYGKDIRLVLNELDPDNYQQLKEAAAPYEDFTKTFHQEAEGFIEKITSALNKPGNEKTHLLFFIDPYGYAQYTPHNLRELFRLPRADYLIFMPTSRIYRFHEKAENPVRAFILNLGMSQDMLKDIDNMDEFRLRLANILNEKAATPFVYSYKLEDKQSSVHHLFFITKDARGAEKFLEAKNAVKGSIADALTLFDFDAPEAEEFLKTALTAETNNERLYIESLKNGFLSKDITPALKSMERSGEVTAAATFKRKAGDFYLGIKPSKRIILRRIK